VQYGNESPMRSRWAANGGSGLLAQSLSSGNLSAPTASVTVNNNNGSSINHNGSSIGGNSNSNNSNSISDSIDTDLEQSSDAGGTFNIPLLDDEEVTSCASLCVRA
jgi:hypothetical protein